MLTFKIDVVTENGTPIRAVLLPDGKSENFPAANSDSPMVEFYDRNYDFTPDGQFTGGRYYVSQLLSSSRQPFDALILNYATFAWDIDGDTMETIVKWMKSFDLENL